MRCWSRSVRQDKKQFRSFMENFTESNECFLRLRETAHVPSPTDYKLRPPRKRLQNGYHFFMFVFDCFQIFCIFIYRLHISCQNRKCNLIVFKARESVHELCSLFLGFCSFKSCHYHQQICSHPFLPSN